MNWVGKPVEAVEDEALLRGDGRFIDDLDPVPGAFHAAVVRSPFASAEILNIDIQAALDSPGVLAVVTGQDLAALTKPFPAVIESSVTSHAAAVDEVRYMGEPVAVVVARDRYQAEDAAAGVLVDYEPRRPLVTPSEALEAGAVVSDRSFEYGDGIGAVDSADLVVEETFVFPRWSGTPMECYGVVADWSPANETLTVWTNFQGPFTLHTVAAAALGLRGSALRLITPPDSGGSFGIKAAVYSYVVLFGAVSRHLGVAVRWTEDRLEHMTGSSAATERSTTLKAGFTSDGELVGLVYDVIEDVGAYLRAPEPATLYRMHGSLSGAYRVRDISVRNRVVLTNRTPTGLNRGFGGPQLYLAIEGVMAIAAARLGLDPVVVAKRNLVAAEDFPYTTPPGSIYDSGDYHASLDTALESIGYDQRREWQAAERASGKLIGIGISCVVEPSVSNMGYISLAETAEERALGLPKSGNTEGATISMSPSGGVVVHISTTPQGQGHRTVAAQVVADQLGISPDQVEVVSVMDTHMNAWSISSGNYSSRFSAMGTAAVNKAAEELAEAIKKVAAADLECSPADIRLSEGKAVVTGQPDASVSLRRVAGTAHWNPQALPEGVSPGLRFSTFVSAPNLDAANVDDRIASSALHGFVADVAVVEVDRETGAVTVIDYATTHDAGVLLNPKLVDGQVLGGFVHGAGVALLERHIYDDDGVLLTGSFMDYLCMTAGEVPPLKRSHLSSPSPFTPLGAKGLGEGNTMSAPVTIANAVRDALGVERIDLPLTPPRVWEMLEAGA